jgi:opacity protein-like surface antigen
MKEIAMKRILLATVLALVLAASAFAAVNTYQVTGPVLVLTKDTITVQKGSEKWEIARDAATKVNGDLKVGGTVTIHYRMTAASIEVKPEKASAPAKVKKN